MELLQYVVWTVYKARIHSVRLKVLTANGFVRFCNEDGGYILRTFFSLWYRQGNGILDCVVRMLGIICVLSVSVWYRQGKVIVKFCSVGFGYIVSIYS